MAVVQKAEDRDKPAPKRIEPPPRDDSLPEHVLEYVARYLTGGPISDRRLIAHEQGHVAFRARTGNIPTTIRIPV